MEMSYEGAIDAIAYALWMGHLYKIEVEARDNGNFGVHVTTGGPCGEHGRVVGNDGQEREFKRRKSAENLRDKITERAKARAQGLGIRHAAWKRRKMKIVGSVGRQMEAMAV